MTVNKILKKYSSIEIELLLADVLGKSKEFLYMNGENRLTRIQVNRLTLMAKRRLRGEPVAYILGYRDFYGLRFMVNKNVLIPRPETELLVERVVQSLLLFKEEYRPQGGEVVGEVSIKTPTLPSRQSGTPSLFKGRMLRGLSIKILDLGTGSGCIAISLTKKIKDLRLKIKVTASDISPSALKVAKQNAKNILTPISHTPVYGRLEFIKSDLLQKIKGDFDMIIANLPYGWNQWKNNTSAATIGLKFEPKQALFTKESGLYEIRRLLQQIAERKHLPKLIYLEFDPRQKAELHELIKKYLPKADVKFYKDLNNLWRFAEITPWPVL